MKYILFLFPIMFMLACSSKDNFVESNTTNNQQVDSIEQSEEYIFVSKSFSLNPTRMKRLELELNDNSNVENDSLEIANPSVASNSNEINDDSEVISPTVTIELVNPSFEGEPAASTTPKGWHDCGKPGETPPDTQPNSTYKVSKKAQQGKTYIGLVTRGTDTWEAIGQLLDTPLEGGKCYYFSLYLARSESYESGTRASPEKINFNEPIVLRIWAGRTYCDKRELLAKTFAVEHTNWQIYKFKLSPRKNYDFIMFEAFYITSILKSYNGNILVDNCSSILSGPCESEEFSDYQKHPKQK